MDVSASVYAMIQPGQSVRMNYGEGNLNNEVRHIRAIVDEEFVVYRVWFKHKRRWEYKVEWVGAFQIGYDAGQLEAVTV